MGIYDFADERESARGGMCALNKQTNSLSSFI